MYETADPTFLGVQRELSHYLSYSNSETNTVGGMLQVLRCFQEEGGGLGLSVCRVKNKFASGAEAEDGYRDLSLSALCQDESGLSIIGEVAVTLEHPAVYNHFQPFLTMHSHDLTVTHVTWARW